MILHFPILDLLLQKIKEQRIKRKISIVLYPILIYTYIPYLHECTTSTQSW